jgi:methyltransferase (TIGR00027 family)
VIEGRPSATAFRVAMRRAVHQLIDRPIVLDDPVALRILGSRGDEVRADPGKFNKTFFDRTLRATLVARSRVAEDELAASVKAGIRQYVVLGAGLDTFAYRNPFPDLRVFEVDHPATQAWKVRLLRGTGIPVPPSVTYVPVDFEKQRLPDELIAAGFDPSQPAWFGWLGVTFYLEPAAVFATLRDVHALAGPGGGIAFDYSINTSHLGLIKRFSIYLIARRVRKAGEPFKSSFKPDALVSELRAIGFSRVTDLTAAALDERYFKNRTDGLRAGAVVHIIVARR